jgi:hypothetical protein
MKTKLTSYSKLVVAAALGLSALSAHAVLLAPGATALLPTGTTEAAEPWLAGTVIVDEMIPFSFSSGVVGAGDITGTVQQRVVRAVDGTLDFYWKINNDANSPAAIGSFRLSNFVSPEYNANWRSDGLGDKAPDEAHRFTGVKDSFVNFHFNVFSTAPGDGLLPGHSSYFVFLDTTATNYAKTATYDLTNMAQNPISGQYAAYSPAPVPEPETYAMMLAGLGMLGFAAKRRKQTLAR